MSIEVIHGCSFCCKPFKPMAKYYNIDVCLECKVLIGLYEKDKSWVDKADPAIAKGMAQFKRYAQRDWDL